MSLNSKAKGARGELLFAHALKALGFFARRGVQYSGSQGSPDVVTNIEGVHFEVKNTEKLNIWSALAQADKDSGPTQIPVVAFKRNRSKWYIAMPLEDMLEFADKFSPADHLTP